MNKYTKEYISKNLSNTIRIESLIDNPCKISDEICSVESLTEYIQKSAKKHRYNAKKKNQMEKALADINAQMGQIEIEHITDETYSLKHVIDILCNESLIYLKYCCVKKLEEDMEHAQNIMDEIKNIVDDLGFQLIGVE